MYIRAALSVSLIAKKGRVSPCAHVRARCVFRTKINKGKKRRLRREATTRAAIIKSSLASRAKRVAKSSYLIVGEPRIFSAKKTGDVRPRADDASRHELPFRWRNVPPPRIRKSPPIAADCSLLLFFPFSFPFLVRRSRGNRYIFYEERSSFDIAKSAAAATTTAVADPPQELPLAFLSLRSSLPRGVNFRARTRRFAARNRGRVKAASMLY